MDLENYFVKAVEECNMTKPLEILNWYRNLYYKEEVQGQSAAQWPDRTVPGILFYDKERLVYLALQFTDVSLSTQQIRTIAQSIRISDTK